jgi:hypothetical protein
MENERKKWQSEEVRGERHHENREEKRMRREEKKHEK